ncbi:MAG: (2Fe-2S)-binding protein [Fibromonadaceae bacterium]|jgi:NADH-quinone oxidoreductase subunit G|nr:(2Fe-2S)-binding protein [Fibromonadaceae bacterium]
MVTIIVDNKEVQVPENTNLIEALKAVGIETPHLCYHPDLPVSGNCRQCLVEVDGPRGMALAIGCYTPVRPGMKVATPASSPKVAESRKAVLEFLLVNHPLDCPICDKAGECMLQENYMMAGALDSRLQPEVGKHYHGNPEHSFTDSKGQHRGGKRIDLGPRIVLDEERCVQCSRCVRFMRHIAGDEQLQLASRGGHSHITTFPGEKLDHPYDRCLADICPVGALTDKAFRFRKRVWALSRVPTISMDNSLGANIWIDHADGVIYRVMPRCNTEVNRSWLSNEARDVVQKIHENRLLSGDIAAASKIIKGVKGKIAIVLGGSCTMEEIEAFKKIAKSLGGKAQLFGGSFLPLQKAGIAHSGDPVANRKGLELAEFNTNLTELLKLAGEFELLITVAADLWDETPKEASGLDKIPKHIALSPFNGSTAKKASVAICIRHWLENSGTMINCKNMEQKLQGVPTNESAQMESAQTIAEKLQNEN